MHAEASILILIIIRVYNIPKIWIDDAIMKNISPFHFQLYEMEYF